MTKYRVIPEGFMTVGQLAKKIGITIRTLQYYDKEGLAFPSAESEGGRRLYTDKDILRKNIEQLKDSLIAIEQLKAEVLQIQTVNFKKYADIIVKLQMRYLHIHFV